MSGALCFEVVQFSPVASASTQQCPSSRDYTSTIEDGIVFSRGEAKEEQIGFRSEDVSSAALFAMRHLD